MAFLPILATTPVRAQHIVCCNQLINVGGDWVGADRNADCQQYLNDVPRSGLVLMCKQRSYLICVNTSRCDKELTSEETAPQRAPLNAAVALPDPDRDGLQQGFLPPTDQLPGTPPSASPQVLFYLVRVVPSSGKPLVAFTAYLDGRGCPLPIAATNEPVEKTAVRHVVRGNITRGDGRVRIVAEAQENSSGHKLGPVTGDSEGEDAGAVGAATRSALTQLRLGCRRAGQ